MLVLSRRRKEVVILKTDQGEIEVMVTGIEPGKVRLAFKAPDSVIIFREELRHVYENTENKGLQR